MLWESNENKRQEHTEQIALELYRSRLRLDKPGDEHSDWAEAVQIARNPIRRTLFDSNRPLIKLREPVKQAFKVVVWDTPRWFLFSLPQLEWVKLLAVPLVIAAAGSIITGQIQREANQNAVLKAYFDKLEDLTFAQNLLAETPNEGAIVLARGRTVAALRELDRPRKAELIAFLQASGLSQIDPSPIEEEDPVEPVISFKGQNLSGLDLRGVNLVALDFRGADLENANLQGSFLFYANLQEARLGWTNLEGASLSNANLEGAFFFKANLQKADLENANLQKVRLGDTNLQEARLTNANLHEALLANANLQGADLANANLQGAYLWNANLQGAVLANAKLQKADLRNANLEGAYLVEANLQGAQNLTQDQLALAKLCRTTLPEDITIDRNRDCEEFGIDPETGEWIGP